MDDKESGISILQPERKRPNINSESSSVAHHSNLKKQSQYSIGTKNYPPLFNTFSETISYLVFLLFAIAAVFYLPEEFIAQLAKPESQMVFNDSSELLQYYSKQGTTLDKARETEKVPRVFPVNLPRDFADQPASLKTPLFINLILTNALKANETILYIRKRLIQLQLQGNLGHRLTTRDREWLTNLAKQYSTTTEITQLLDRVDIIPVSLTIAQAITESGWGSSRFAHSGNALFGQHLPQNSNGKYILSRSGNIKVAAFDSIYASTLSYIHNLNTSRAYGKLRKIRTGLRREQQHISGYSLAAGLKHYSAKGNKYIDTIQFLIRYYNLTSLEHVALTKDSPPVMIRFTTPPG